MHLNSQTPLLMASVNGSTLERLGPSGRHHRKGMEMVERNERTNIIAGVLVMMSCLLLSIVIAWAISSVVNLATAEDALLHIPEEREPMLFELGYHSEGAIWYSPADLGIATDNFTKRYDDGGAGQQLAEAGVL